MKYSAGICYKKARCEVSLRSCIPPLVMFVNLCSSFWFLCFISIGQGFIPLVPNQPKTETRTSVINWRRYESNCALGDTGQQGICARDARVLYSEVFAKLFRLFDPAAVFVVDDDWTWELPGILSIYHFSCEESYLVLPERLDNYHSGNGEYINILIRCYLEDSQRLILQISKSSSLRQRYVNWILLGQSAQCLDNPGSFVERPGDNVLTFDAAEHAPSVRHVNGSDALLALDLKVTQREQPPTLKEVSLALCQSPCSSRRERREPLSLREAAAFIAQKFTSFNGRRLRVAAESYPPFFDFTNDGGYRGVDIEILNSMAANLNFSYEIVRPPDGKWGSQNEDGSWNGMVGMVNTGEVDLAMAGITITASRSTASDFTYRYHTEPSVVAVKVDTNKSLYFIRPLKGLLVLLYLLLPLFLSLLALAVEVCLQRLATSRHRAFILQPWAAWFGNAVFSFARKIFTIGLSVRYLSRARFVLFLEFCFLVCVIVMSATYSGNLTAAMAVRRIEWPFRDLQGLAEADDYVLLLAEGTLREDLFKESKDGVYKQLSEKYSSHTIRSSENDDLMRILRKGSPKAAFTADRTDIVKRRVKGDCDILMLRETYFPAGFGFSIPKQATYLDAFNHVIQKLLQSGVIERWYEKNLPQLPSNMCTDEMVASSDTVRLEDIEFIICFVMCGGLCLATAALFLESNMRNLNASARWLTGSKQS